MLKMVLEKQKTKKFIIINILAFLIFMILYTIIDSLNLSYQEMYIEYGWYLPFINILLNIVMSLMCAMMMSFTTALFDITGKEGKGSSFSYLSVLFGMLTYGCTPCVIALFAAIGVTFTVIALPLAGLPYKLIALLIVIIGFSLIIIQIRRAKCKIKLIKKNLP